MMFGSNGAVDFIKPAKYLIEELNPLLTKVLENEKSVYTSLFGKRKKAQKYIDLYDNLLIALGNVDEIAEGAKHQKGMGKVYADNVVLLHNLYVALIESRIAVLREFIANGKHSTQARDLGQKTVQIGHKYVECLELVEKSTESLYNIYNDMGLFDIQ